MRRLEALSLLLFYVASAARGQEPSAAQQMKSNGPVAISKMGPDTTAPALMPVDFSAILSKQCEHKFHGKVEIALIVDAHGQAQNMLFLKPAANDLDRVAIFVTQMDRFTPAIRAGTAVAMGQTLELKLEACFISQVDSAGQKNYMLRLSSMPEQKLKPYDGYPPEVIFAAAQLPASPRPAAPDQSNKPVDPSSKVGGSVSAPFPITSPEAEYSDEGRRKNINGLCLLTLIVDAYGLPQRLKVVRSLEPTLDQKALEAVARYRFKPALRNKMEPVPVMITIEVNFRRG